MGCVGCEKNRKKREAARGETLYIKCVGCETLLHGRRKDMLKIDGNLVCGECYKRYKKMTTKIVKPSEKATKAMKEQGIATGKSDLSKWKKEMERDDKEKKSKVAEKGQKQPSTSNVLEGWGTRKKQ